MLKNTCTLIMLSFFLHNHLQRLGKIQKKTNLKYILLDSIIIKCHSFTCTSELFLTVTGGSLIVQASTLTHSSVSFTLSSMTVGRKTSTININTVSKTTMLLCISIYPLLTEISMSNILRYTNTLITAT